MKQFKRIGCYILALTMLVLSVPFTAGATSDDGATPVPVGPGGIVPGHYDIQVGDVTYKYVDGEELFNGDTTRGALCMFYNASDSYIQRSLNIYDIVEPNSGLNWEKPYF